MSRKNERRSKGFKVMALVLAFVLVIGASVAGTLAWLTAQTGAVKNTFTAGELFSDPDNQFTLWEHEATDEDEDGVYTLSDQKTTQGNSYTYLPGVTIPKDPTVEVTNLEANAYLFVVVKIDMRGSIQTTMGADWAQLEDTEGAVKYNGDNVFVYQGNYATYNVIQASKNSSVSFTSNILANNQITIPADHTNTDDMSLTFTAYMVQATGNGSSALEAWNNTYGNTTP